MENFTSNGYVVKARYRQHKFLKYYITNRFVSYSLRDCMGTFFAFSSESEPWQAFCVLFVPNRALIDPGSFSLASPLLVGPIYIEKLSNLSYYGFGSFQLDNIVEAMPKSLWFLTLSWWSQNCKEHKMCFF